jgi:hypothetical protein
MKPILTVFGFAVLAALVVFGAKGSVITDAQASDVWVYTLNSYDAGSTNTVTLTAGREYAVQCQQPACYKTGTTSVLVPDCAKDLNLPGTKKDQLNAIPAVVPAPRTVEAGGHTKLAAYALDAGNPVCTVYQVTKNP